MCTNPFFGLGKQYVEAFSVHADCPIFLHLKRIKHEVHLLLSILCILFLLILCQFAPVVS